MKICSVPGCEGRYYAKGFCGPHYWRAHKRGGDPAVARRKPNGSFYVGNHGYPTFNANGQGPKLVHRLVWEEAYGPIPPGMHIHHKNGNRLDFRLENLEMLPMSEHLHLHKAKKLA